MKPQGSSPIRCLRVPATSAQMAADQMTGHALRPLGKQTDARGLTQDAEISAALTWQVQAAEVTRPGPSASARCTGWPSADPSHRLHIHTVTTLCSTFRPPTITMLPCTCCSRLRPHFAPACTCSKPPHALASPQPRPAAAPPTLHLLQQAEALTMPPHLQQAAPCHHFNRNSVPAAASGRGPPARWCGPHSWPGH